MNVRREVQEFLGVWSERNRERDVERLADLFLRDPAPLVTFTNGDRAEDWLDVRIRIGRDFERAVLERVDVHNVRVQAVTPEATAVSFEYDLHVRDMWGTATTATRFATMTLVRTKDGLRIAAAHFSAAR